jgi:heme/copper-type cytochrome/quinol oxidase subunit 2
VKNGMKIVELLIVALVFMALFPTIYSAFVTPTGNAVPYNATTTVIFALVPLLIVIGLLYYMWSSSVGRGGLKI